MQLPKEIQENFDFKQQVMDNLKYSLKTQQFGKKRQQIFSKDQQKQSISLVVHEPIDPNIYVQQSKSSNSSGVILMPEENDNKQKNNNFYVTGNKHSANIKSLSQHCAINKKYVNHAMNACNKLRVPQFLACNKGIACSTKMDNTKIQQLQLIRQLFIANQERLAILTNSINSLYTNTIELYNNHERKMKELVSMRCWQIANLFKVALTSFKAKDQKINQLDDHVTLLLNTIKDTKETLRIVKIKQQCIQAFQKQQSNFIHQKVASNQMHFPSLRINTNLNSKIRNQQNSQFELFKSQSQINLQNEKKYNNKTQIQKQASTLNNNQSFEIFIEKIPYNLQAQSFTEIYKKSPFQTHEMLTISQTVPMESKKLWEPKHIDYSFRKNYQHQQRLTQQKANKQPKTAMINQSDLLRTKLKKIMAEFAKKQVWQDNLNCLRFGNGTYVLDSAGDAIICTKQQFKIFLSEGIIKQWNKN